MNPIAKKTLALALAFTMLPLFAEESASMDSGPLLFINSSRPADATLDGLPAGKAPLLLDSLKAGPHEIVLRAEEGIAKITIKVDPKAHGTSVWSPAFAPYAGSLSVRSEAEGMEVAVDGKLVGKTPLLLFSIPAGKHAVGISGGGFLPEIKEVTVPREGKADVTFASVPGYPLAFDPPLPPGSAISLLDPSGAIAASWPSAEPRLLPAGLAKFRVEGPGLPATSFEIDPSSGASISLEALAAPSFIAIEGLSPGFTLSLDGKASSVEGGKAAALPGAKRVLVEAEGRLPFYGFVMLGAGSTGALSPTLPEPYSMNPLEGLEAKIVLVGIGAGLAAGGYIFNLNSVATGLSSTYSEYYTIKNVSNWTMLAGLATALIGLFFV